MNAYADSGFLVSFYVQDSNSQPAIACMQAQTLPLSWTWLHEMEFRNAIRLKVFRKEIKEEEIQKIFKYQTEDLESGVHTLAIPSFTECAAEFEKLSARFCTQLGTRSLDILHVAHAVVLGAKEFLTFDHRQAALAKAAGLKVPKL